MERLEPNGRLKARSTCDAVALERDDDQHFAMNRLEEPHGCPDDHRFYEIQFGTGTRFLCGRTALSPGLSAR